MPHSIHQMVFPFLADDPAYIRDLREERIIEEAKADLEPVLHSQMIDILHGLAKAEFKEHLEMLVADAVEHVMKDVRVELHSVDQYGLRLYLLGPGVKHYRSCLLVAYAQPFLQGCRKQSA